MLDIISSDILFIESNKVTPFTLSMLIPRAKDGLILGLIDGLIDLDIDGDILGLVDALGLIEAEVGTSDFWYHSKAKSENSNALYVKVNAEDI